MGRELISTPEGRSIKELVDVFSKPPHSGKSGFYPPPFCLPPTMSNDLKNYSLSFHCLV